MLVCVGAIESSGLRALFSLQNLVWSAQEEAASLPTCAWKKAALLPPSKTPTPTPTPPFSHLNESSWDAVQGVKPSVDTAVELLWKIDSGCMADITLLINDQVIPSPLDQQNLAHQSLSRIL